VQSRRGTLIIVVSSLFFACMAVLVRHLSKHLPPSQLAFIRFSMGALAMTLVFAARRQAPQLAHPFKLLLRGLFGTASVLTYFIAIERLGSGPATVLNYSSPIAAAVFAGLFLHEKTTVRTRLGLLLATTGAVVVTAATGEFSHPLHPGIGGLCGALSGLFAGAAITLIRSLRADTNAPTVFLAFSSVGATLTAPLALPAWVPLDGSLLPLAVLMGLLSIGGQLLFTWGMGFTSATAGSATTQLVPVMAWVLGVTVLSEPIAWLSVVGTVLCVGGVLLGTLRQQAAPPRTQPSPPEE